MIHASDYSCVVGDDCPVVPMSPGTGGSPLNRLREVRCQEELSRRTVARHLGMTETEVGRLEGETTDLPLSILRKWAEALDVPVAELIEEPNESLSLPVLKRARLLRIMKAARAILERASDSRTKRWSQMIVDELVEIMPELREVKPWKATPPRRRRDDYGSALLHRLSASVFYDAQIEAEETP
jgi:transcriptional regulator with XRE-family HTH domain